MEKKNSTNYTKKEILILMFLVFIVVSAIAFIIFNFLGEGISFSIISAILFGIICVLPISIWHDRKTKNAKPINLKKFVIVFTGILLVGAIAVGYSYFSNPKPEKIIMYSLEKDYCFAVDAPYDGDTFDSGTYHFYQDNVVTVGKAKAWEIYVCDKPHDCSSELEESENVGIVGTSENKELNLDIPENKYVYVKYRGGENFEGSLEVELTPNK